MRLTYHYKITPDSTPIRACGPVAISFTRGFSRSGLICMDLKNIILYDFETIPSHSHGFPLVIIYYAFSSDDSNKMMEE